MINFSTLEPTDMKFDDNHKIFWDASNLELGFQNF